ncbi:unnamed protein product [Rhizoctonia solani]|uniref:D-isomer specific 2-hydroxyacid dehydrogenase catalytic domain-containing protein n=1 Tax=Rhizoctonia solani TaxID=456999 RepID=A0A8H3CY11_9AGAM|nr:unnamed protein product [Rhizoctonia solani]
MSAATNLRRNILICARPSKLHANDRLQVLESRHHVSIVSQQTRQALMTNFQQLAAERPYHAIVFYPGFINATIGKWDKNFFSPFSKSLELVVGAGAGYDHTDVAHLTKTGVYYANAPVSVSEPTAMTTVTLVLQTIRATTQAEMTLRKGQWTEGLEPTDDIRDLTIGIVGYGTIGRVSTNAEVYRSPQKFNILGLEACTGKASGARCEENPLPQ